MNRSNPSEVYDCLMRDATAGDRFDIHVFASVLALAVAESEVAKCKVVKQIGLGHDELQSLIDAFFPYTEKLIYGPMDSTTRALRYSEEPDFPASNSALRIASGPDPGEDEIALRQLLLRFSSCDSAHAARLSAIIARRALRPNHLWQDLGLRTRGELSQLMKRHFQPLSARNSGDMKWKKFLYRMICRDGGFHLCAAPCCSECSDFSVCFGDESGESLLAANRRKAESKRVAISIDI